MRHVHRELKLACAGGGSLGHIIPGAAVVEVLRQQSVTGKAEDISLFWFCSRSPAESAYLRSRGIEAVALPAARVYRYFTVRHLLTPVILAGAVLKALWTIILRRPQLLFCKGGFAAAAPVIAARLCRIPVIVHDSDIDPGLVTRLSLRTAAIICVPYEESRKHYPVFCQQRIAVTGNPVRKNMYTADAAVGRRICGIEQEEGPVVLVLGGSSGSLRINALTAGAIDALSDSCIVIHQTGSAAAADTGRKRYILRKQFGEELSDVIAAADIVVSRAGAGALSELALQGKPMILIPLSPRASRGDQLRNAEFFKKKGAAVVLDEEKTDTQAFSCAILRLVHDLPARRALAEAAASLANPSAAGDIANLIRTCMAGGEGDIRHS